MVLQHLRIINSTFTSPLQEEIDFIFLEVSEKSFQILQFIHLPFFIASKPQNIRQNISKMYIFENNEFIFVSFFEFQFSLYFFHQAIKLINIKNHKEKKWIKAINI